MNTPLLYASLLAATIMVSAGAGTDTDVYKCSDAEGHVLLTDKPCGPGLTALAMTSAAFASEVSAAAAGPSTEPAAIPATTPDTGWTTAEPDNSLVAVVIRAPSPGALLRAKPLRPQLAIDVDTLKQAKLAMLNDDAAWASQRALRD